MNARAALSPLVLALVLAGCDIVPSARVHAGYMQTEATGTAGLATGGGTPPTNDVEADLGVDDPSGKLQLRGEVKVGPLHGTARTLAFHGTGDGALGQPFGGIGGGTPVASDLDVFDFDVAASWDVIDIGPVRISPGLGVDFFDVDMAVTGSGTTTGFSSTYELPFVFLQGEVELGPLGAVAELGWSDLEIGDDDMELVDLSLMLVYQPAALLEVYAGYRTKSFEALSTDGAARSVDLDLEGWFIGGGVRF